MIVYYREDVPVPNTTLEALERMKVSELVNELVNEKTAIQASVGGCVPELLGKAAKTLVDLSNLIIYNFQDSTAGSSEETAAVRTLNRQGYTYTQGAREWRPPLGPEPNFDLDDSLSRDSVELKSRLDASVERERTTRDILLNVIDRYSCQLSVEKSNSAHETQLLVELREEVRRLRTLVREVVTEGLVYWVPQTSWGRTHKSIMVARCERAVGNLP